MFRSDDLKRGYHMTGKVGAYLWSVMGLSLIYMIPSLDEELDFLVNDVHCNWSSSPKFRNWVT